MIRAAYPYVVKKFARCAAFRIEPILMLKERQYIAVHFNFKAGALSLRRINPQTGKLTDLLAVQDEVWLEDAEFTTDRDKWQKWREGTQGSADDGRGKPKVRQFAEVRGKVLNAPPPHDEAALQDVLYNPHNRHDFHLKSGKSASRASLIHIKGRQMRALF